MALELTLVPITPKRAIIDTVGFVNNIDRELATKFAGAVIRDMTDYPRVLPWRHGFPKSGPRRGGRRTTRYGRGWQLSAHRRGTFIRVSNRVPYAVYVGGPTLGPKGQRQAWFHGPRGWKSISAVVIKHWPSSRDAIVAIIRTSTRSRRPFPS